LKCQKKVLKKPANKQGKKTERKKEIREINKRKNI